MNPASRYRQLPSTGRSIGFELSTPGDVVIQPGDDLVRCREQRPDGKTVGELEVSVFKAALLIDRDGILEEKANEVAGGHSGRASAPVAVELPGASGYRADVEGARGQPLPYVHVFAIASHDFGIDGGVIVTVRSAAPEWPAADAIMKSLRILGRRGRTANDTQQPESTMPLPPILGKKG